MIKNNPSLAITDCHHSASLEMPIGDPRDGFFYPILTLMMDTYILTCFNINKGHCIHWCRFNSIEMTIRLQSEKKIIHDIIAL